MESLSADGGRRQEKSACEVRLLRRPEVCQLVGLSYSSVWNMMRRGEFPRPLRIPGGKSVRWRSDEIDAWMDTLPRGGRSLPASLDTGADAPRQ